MGPLATQVPEFSLAIFAQLTGACVYAAIFGNIAQLIQKYDASGARFQQQLRAAAAAAASAASCELACRVGDTRQRDKNAMSDSRVVS